MPDSQGSSPRRRVYALVLAVGALAWMPRAIRWVGDWRDYRRQQRNVCILYTTETRNYLESCGCEHASGIGTIAGRHGYFADQRGKRPHLLLVDSGNAVDGKPRTEITARALAMGAYDAVGTGAEEIRLGEAYARSAKAHKLPLVRAVARGDVLDGLGERLRIFRLAGRAIGVTAAPPPPKGRDLDGYRESLVEAMAGFRGQCDVLVLLSQLGLEGDRDLARRCGERGPHVLIGGAEAQALAQPEQIGGTTLVPTAPGGARVAGLDIAFPWWGSPRVEHVESCIAQGTPDLTLNQMVKEYFKETEKAFLRGIDPRLLTPAMDKGAGDVVRCRACHERQAQQWIQSSHSRATGTLIGWHRMVPECVVCHSVRYRDTGIFDHAARAGSVDCTACHPAARMGEASACPQKSTRTRGAATCVVCHNAIHNPSFSYARKLPLVNHTK